MTSSLGAFPERGVAALQLRLTLATKRLNGFFATSLFATSLFALLPHFTISHLIHCTYSLVLNILP
jgi:hypothetical protein